MDLVTDLGSSFVNSLLSTATNTVISYFKDKKQDEKYVEIIKVIEEKKKGFENDLLSYAESKISKSNFIEDEILSQFDSNLIASTIKQIFEKEDKDSKIKNEIDDLIKNYKFSENL